MNLYYYQQQAASTAFYPGKGEPLGLSYAALGLAGESGEVAEKVKKILRDSDGVITDDRRNQLQKELGDVLWYVSALCGELGLSMSDVAAANIEKLQDRANRNALSGDGDNR